MRILLYVLLFTGFIIFNDPKIQKTYSSDVNMLSAVINGECSSCSLTEMYLVGSVVLNRVKNKNFPQTLKGVVLQTRQFHAIKTKGFHPTNKTTKVAKDLISGLYITPNVLYFCTKASRVKPMDIITITGEFHYFGK